MSIDVNQVEVLRTALRNGYGREPTNEEIERLITYVLVALEIEQRGVESAESGLAHNLLDGHVDASFDAAGELSVRITDAGRAHIEGIMRAKGLNID
jgi:hypothetical protein